MEQLTLGQAQRKFTRMLADLIIWAYDHGYELTLGEAFRPPELAKEYAARGTGIANSLHCDRLAIDLNLFKDGHFLASNADHEPLGLFWESIGGTWGGKFNDGNHYSLSYGGRK